MSKAYFIFIVFCVTAFLVFVVYLRSQENRFYYELCTSKARQSRLQQMLGRKQIELESIINPSAIDEYMGAAQK
jgi:hypothetical protein